MDSLRQKKPEDGSRINLTEAWEIRYWMKALKVSEEALREAVKKAGHGADAVRWHLQKKS